jgi:hypothetical protein
MRTLLFAMAPLTVAMGCGGPVACTLEFRLGLVVTVVNGATGAPRCDARVTITDGAYRETLASPPFPGTDGGMNCSYEGAGERAGTYTVEASADGIEKTLTNVVVTRDACHVQTQAITIVL